MFRYNAARRCLGLCVAAAPLVSPKSGNAWQPWRCLRCSVIHSAQHNEKPIPGGKFNLRIVWWNGLATDVLMITFSDLSVGLINVLTDIVWRMTVSWNAGNAACKIIRFLQVSCATNPEHAQSVESGALPTAASGTPQRRLVAPPILPSRRSLPRIPHASRGCGPLESRSSFAWQIRWPQTSSS